MTRIGIAGAGLAGTLLAWRLAAARPDWSIELVGPRPPTPDATAVSGGLVRGFETDAVSSRQAADSLVELRSDPRLRAWSGYCETGSIYVCHEMSRATVEARVAAVDARLPGSARVLSAAELAERHGWSGLPAGSLAVVEAAAGHYSPDSLRGAIAAGLGRSGVAVLDGRVGAIGSSAGAASCEVAGRRRRYDALVIAAGSWTPRLLAAADLPAPALRTKVVEYAVYAPRGRRPPPFVDDTSGLYGRPAAGGRMILGLPSDRWDVDPDRLRPASAAATAAAAMAVTRFADLRLGSPLALRTAADCYSAASRLALAPVAGAAGCLYTFTGGSGGSAKTALCASREAVDALVRDVTAGVPAAV
jgi:glycine/D-amino acid oxidase-like deaminating enzyme